MWRRRVIWGCLDYSTSSIGDFENTAGTERCRKYSSLLGKVRRQALDCGPGQCCRPSPSRRQWRITFIFKSNRAPFRILIHDRQCVQNTASSFQIMNIAPSFSAEVERRTKTQDSASVMTRRATKICTKYVIHRIWKWSLFSTWSACRREKDLRMESKTYSRKYNTQKSGQSEPHLFIQQPKRDNKIHITMLRIGLDQPLFLTAPKKETCPPQDLEIFQCLNIHVNMKNALFVKTNNRLRL